MMVLVLASSKGLNVESGNTKTTKTILWSSTSMLQGPANRFFVLTIAPWCEERDTLAEVRIHIELEWLDFSPPLPTSLTDHHTAGGDRDSDGDDDDGDECQADEEHFINVLPSVACLEMALCIKASK